MKTDERVLRIYCILMNWMDVEGGKGVMGNSESKLIQPKKSFFCLPLILKINTEKRDLGSMNPNPGKW